MSGLPPSSSSSSFAPIEPAGDPMSLLAAQYAGGTSATENRISRYVAQISDGAEAFNADRAAKKESKFAPHAKFTNWAEIGSCHPSRHFSPSSTEEVAIIVKTLFRQANAAVKNTPSSHTEVKVVGGGASPNDMAFTNQHMIHMSTNMSKIISLDTQSMQVTAQAGVTIKHLIETLEAANLMIACVPSFTALPTIGGCIATGMHGSGVETKVFGAYVVRMTVVTGSGDIKVIDRKANPTEWAHWACHIGVLGVVTEVTLQAERSSLWNKREQPIRIKDAAATMIQRARFNDYYRLLYVPYSDTCYETVMKRAVAADEDHVDLQSTTGGSAKSIKGGGFTSSSSSSSGNNKGDKGFLQKQQEQSWKVVRGVVKAAHEPHITQRVWEKDKEQQQRFISAVSGMLPDPRLAKVILSNPLMAVQHSMLERALYAAAILHRTKIPLQQFILQQPNFSSLASKEVDLSTACPPPPQQQHLQATINQAYQRAFLNDNKETFGTASAVMTMDCLFKQYTSEWAIPAELAVLAFKAIPALIHQHNLQGVHFPVEFRFVAASNVKTDSSAEDIPLITLDPCRADGAAAATAGGSSKNSGVVCFVGAVMFRPLGLDAPETHLFLDAFNHLMRTKLHGRPHWAKYYRLSRSDMLGLYPSIPSSGLAGWEEFDRYRAECDPAGLFVNDWLEKLNA